MTAPMIATARCTCPSMPTQYEGTLTDGRVFYFRYRTWEVQFGIGQTLDDAVQETIDHPGFRDFGGPGEGWVQDLKRTGDGAHEYGRLDDAEVRELLPQLLTERLAR